MALLDPVHWDTITPPMRDMLRFIGGQPFAARFYLAGGTALALRLGHRRSADLDFFSVTDDVHQKARREILDALAPLTPQTLEDVDGNLLLRVSDLHVGFFSYSYSLLEQTDSVEGIAVASVVDIGMMKLDTRDFEFMAAESMVSFENADRDLARPAHKSAMGTGTKLFRCPSSNSR